MKAFVTIFIIISFLLVDTINAGNANFIDKVVRLRYKFFLLFFSDIPKDIYEKYNKSYKQWQNIKKLWKNSYQYTTEKSSWTGYKSRTTAFFVNGEVVAREQTVFDRGVKRSHWFENKDQLYSHSKNLAQVQPLTLDGIYSKCLQFLNVSSPNSDQKYRLKFEVDTVNQGLLNSCGHYPIGCLDDCFFGVSIDNVKPYQHQQPLNTTISVTSTEKNTISGGKVKKPNKNRKAKKIINDEKIKKD